ncbi:SulP family inorganic anion transporter [Desulfospira joergensenii]|uniref:SulP family inorganic anion transporter n=1 Tax=Desulfospira joergensenii TaxID=53329 RepID=UPI0003B317FA|nr:SulP family inorganic anion transporter [Desulfospira joergensenii]
MSLIFRKAAPVRAIPLGIKLFPFLQWIRQVTAGSLRADLLAGLTGAFIVLPQGVSFAMIAGLPAEYGLYAAIIPPIIAALFGSSMHLVSGPTTAISIIVFSTLSPLAEPGTADYVRLALTLTFLAGTFQLVFGLARLGTLINFVSHSVIVGFTAGAAFLIATSQLKHALGIPIPSGSSFLTSWMVILKASGQINYYEAAIALATLACAALFKTLRPRWPGLLAALIVGSLVCLGINGQAHGVRLLGELPGRLPPISAPDFTMDTLRLMAPGALAVAFLGLIEALSIARSITVLSNQHINGNQEFIGQGLSNIAGSFFSGYASSGSFTRSGVNYDSGAVSPLASIFSALFLAVIVLLVAPLTAWLPLPAMGGVIFFVAFKLIDVRHIREILKSSRSDTLVLLATFGSTLLFEIDFAIYTGVLLSMAIYLTRTSHPHVAVMAPDPSDQRRRLTEVVPGESAECPQLKILRINGSLFFGAANHVSAILEEMDEEDPLHMLIVGYGINFIDVSGAMVLAQEAQRRKKMKKNLFLCRINQNVRRFLRHGGFVRELREDHMFSTEYEAIARIFDTLDRRICLTCKVRIFSECKTVPGQGEERE